MPKTSWFKKLWNWKKNKNKKKRSNLRRTRNMKPFKIDNSSIKVKAYDLNGRDLSHYLRYSHVYNGIPGGFYLDTKQMNRDSKYYY
tara:strand:+ start:284 stop:541 length:258 start_codon:yes stop_codon:yes gene_type:complete